MKNTDSHSERLGCQRQPNGRSRGFTLAEVMTALVILAMVCSGVWVVIDRCMAAAADSALRMAAFEVVRENMEKVLSSNSAKETVEYGTCDKYPDISWESTVETFSEPINGKMWVRAVCSAEYVDISGQTQTVELEHWLTDLTEQQVALITKAKESQEAEAADQLLATVEQAAEYAGVDAGTIEKWVADGLVKAEDGSFIKHNLDIFVQSDGKCTADDKAKQVKSVTELSKQAKQQGKPTDQKIAPDKKLPSGDEGSVTGLKPEDIEKLDVKKFMELLKNRRQK